MNKLEWALKHAARGWAVFPCLPGAKLPAIKAWPEKATTDENQIRYWWGQNPDYNIAIATGEKSNLTVLDVDDTDLFNTSMKATQWANDGSEYVVNTPNGGYHTYYDGAGYKNSVKKIPGADIRCEGGYVIAAGSTGYDREESSDGGFTVDVPLWLEDCLTTVSATPTPQHDDGPVIIGGRNNALTQVAGLLRRNGWLSLAMLEAANKSKCSPPLDEAEVELIYNSVMTYAVEVEPVFDKPDEKVFISLSSLKDEMRTALTDKPRLMGQATGFPGLDRMLGGGLRQGEFTALNAIAKTGKSSLIHKIIHEFVTKNIPVGYASREMRPHDEVAPNLLSIEFGENAWKAVQDEARQAKYDEKMDTWPLYFTPGYATYLLDKFVPWVAELKQRGVNYFFIDHLHYCLEDPEEYKEAVKLAQAFKRIANEQDVSIFAIIQPTKIYEGMSLGLHSLRGGAGIGQTLDTLLTLERYINPNGTKSDTISVLCVSDIRNKLGRTGRIYLEYDLETTKLQEVTENKAKQMIVEVPSVETNQTTLAKAVS